MNHTPTQLPDGTGDFKHLLYQVGHEVCPSSHGQHLRLLLPHPKYLGQAVRHPQLQDLHKGRNDTWLMIEQPVEVHII